MAENVKKEISDLRDAVIRHDIKGIENLAKKALEMGIGPIEVITMGLSPGMREVGRLWMKMELFLPEVMASVQAYYRGLDIVKPHMKKGNANYFATMIIGSIWGDVHTVGKDVCIPVFQSEDFNVIDLGIDVPTARFIEAAKKHNSDVIGLGTYMSETFMHTKEVVDGLRDAGILTRNRLVICGGPAVDGETARKMGAHDAFNDACVAVKDVKNRILEMRKGG